LANSTSYGIFVEVNVGDLDKNEKRECFGPSGIGFSIEPDKNEEPGRYFHPLLATLITGAARLMLAISATLATQAGLDWAFCDTDSMALSNPGEMDMPTFFSTAQAVCDWFKPLNPYEKKGPLFKIEDANFGITPDPLAELIRLFEEAGGARPLTDHPRPADRWDLLRYLVHTEHQGSAPISSQQAGDSGDVGIGRMTDVTAKDP
jgi:hypothetical protein